MKKKTFNIVKVGITILLFYLIFARMDLQHLWKLLSNANILNLLFAIFLMFLITLILGLRLSIVSGIPFRIFPKLMLKVYFFNNFLPAQVGGDLYKYFSLKKYKNGTETLSAIFSDRLLGITGLLLFSLFNVLVFTGYISDTRIYYGIALYLGILLTILGIVFLMPFIKLDKLKSKWLNKGFSIIFRINKDTRDYYNSRFNISIIFTILAYFILALVNMYAMKALNMRVDFWACFVYVPLISVAVTTFPISFNGLGVRESLYILFFGMAGYAMEESVGMALVNLISILIVSLTGGILVLLSNERINTLRSINSPFTSKR